jgi:hypothetical protein
MALKIGAVEWNVAIEYAERFFGDRGVAEIGPCVRVVNKSIYEHFPVLNFAFGPRLPLG